MKFKNGTSLPAPDGETLTRDYEQARNLKTICFTGFIKIKK